MAKNAAAAPAAEPKSDDTSAAPTATETPAPAAAETPAADPAAPKAKAEKTYTKAEVEAERQKAAAEALKKANEEKDLSELERANKRIQELESGQRLRDAKDAVTAALTKAGARSPELIWQAMKGDLEFDDKGGVKNLDALVNSYKTDFADAFGIEKPGETINGGAGGQAATKLTIEQIQKMTPEQINENWEEVEKVLKAGK